MNVSVKHGGGRASNSALSKRSENSDCIFKY